MGPNFPEDLTLRSGPSFDALPSSPWGGARSAASRRQQIGCCDTGFPAIACVAHPSRWSLRDLLRMRTLLDRPKGMSGGLKLAPREWLAPSSEFLWHAFGSKS